MSDLYSYEVLMALNQISVHLRRIADAVDVKPPNRNTSAVFSTPVGTAELGETVNE